MGTKGSWAVDLPLTAESTEEKYMSILGGVDRGGCYSVPKTLLSVKLGADVVGADPGALLSDPGVQFTWAVATAWGLTGPLRD